MRANYSFVLVFLASIFFLAKLSSASSRLGGWTPIKNMGDPHVTEIVEFALSEHNKEANSEKLGLSRVIKGETQVVGGVKHKLIIEAKDYGGKVGRFEVVVFERAWDKFMKLVSFKPVEV